VLTSPSAPEHADHQIQALVTFHRVPFDQIVRIQIHTTTGAQQSSCSITWRCSSITSRRVIGKRGRPFAKRLERDDAEFVVRHGDMVLVGERETPIEPAKCACEKQGWESEEANASLKRHRARTPRRPARAFRRKWPDPRHEAPASPPALGSFQGLNYARHRREK
jgi:hypothetical protein